MDATGQKRAAGEAAAELVAPGMKLGLGTGSTAEHFVRAVGCMVADGLDIVCVPTSEATAALARSLSIPLTTLDEIGHLDLTVDGADELDDRLRLIKGGGGALLREKIVAAASASMVVIADHSKHVKTLGRFALPVEVVPFGHAVTARQIADVAEAAGARGEITLRRGEGGRPFATDGQHYIYDCAFGAIDQPEALAAALTAIAGVVEHGLFIGLAQKALIGGPDGVVTLDIS